MPSKLSKEIINERISHKDMVLVGEYHGCKIQTTFQCSLGHIWQTCPEVALRSRCPFCSGRRLTGEIINDRLSLEDRGIVIVGKYTDALTKTEFRCILGNHFWQGIPANILHGNGCPYCADHTGGGFKPDKPAWIYVIKFANYIKYGITNNLERRPAVHKRNGKYTVITSKYFAMGQSALNLENDVKNIFGGRFVNKEICPDGYTETLCVSRLSDLVNFIEMRLSNLLEFNN